MRRYQEYPVWVQAHQLTRAVYEVTKSFPKAERFGLTAQLRRSISSIPTNIAEGSGRNSPKEFARFLDIAAGSANEAEYQLLLARDLGHLADVTRRELNANLNEVRMMLVALRRHVLRKR